MCWKGFPWEKWSCFHKQFLFFSCIFISVSLSEKRCDIQCLGFTKLSQESCGLPEWFLSRIYFKNYMFFPEGKIKCGWELNKKGVIWTMRVILRVISCSVALLLVQHLAQCCPGLAVCAAIASVFMYLYIQGMDLGYKTPGFLKKKTKKLVELELDVLSLKCFPQMWSILGW